jgi:hypothetical protein
VGSGRAKVAFAAVGCVVLAIACSRKPGPSGVTPRSGPAPGAVTLRFTNTTGVELFVDAKADRPVTIVDKDGHTLAGRLFCQPVCEPSCQCAQCGSPADTVRRVPPGGAFTWVWDGDLYEEGRCAAGCGCGDRRFAEDGVYTVSLKAGRKTTATGAPSGDTLYGRIDPSGGWCVAKGTVALRTAPQTVEVAFACP